MINYLRGSPQIRFWPKVDKSENCWLWRGSRQTHGYGTFYYQGTMHLSHRISWILTYGEIPTGLCVLHKCDNPPCVNPQHLFLGTHVDNMIDRERKGRGKFIVACRAAARMRLSKTCCKYGHPLEGENLYRHPRGYRSCRICVRESQQRYYRRKEAEALRTLSKALKEEAQP